MLPKNNNKKCVGSNSTIKTYHYSSNMARCPKIYARNILPKSCSQCLSSLFASFLQVTLISMSLCAILYQIKNDHLPLFSDSIFIGLILYKFNILHTVMLKSTRKIYIKAVWKVFIVIKQTTRTTRKIHQCLRKVNLW